ncbi:Lrp/AsnC family transcriptional regulator [Thalassotalea sp. M1531]|uniref:siroheme decarboxylase n=1 Tax=Thalassotalea algicola TaxID=2716224 RepID=A0A7Y0LC21_9GAMM|nr:Lrp/AsnC family transcriptional regulator [Thalassotalea algicola]NMP31783.1 Lrp/AsnC family transcriptional regulator [Thalassotalea algicola]
MTALAQRTVPDTQTIADKEHSYQQLLALIETGIPLSSKPFQQLADLVNLTEQEVIDAVNSWQEQGLIKRFGLVVKHRKLGFIANAMVVWNIPDELVEDVAAKLAKQSCVTLCYRRPRVLPGWPYNLFCMIHGQCREKVLASLEAICQELSLTHIEKDVLFSTKAYKQNGARYAKRTLKEAK